MRLKPPVDVDAVVLSLRECGGTASASQLAKLLHVTGREVERCLHALVVRGRVRMYGVTGGREFYELLSVV